MPRLRLAKTKAFTLAEVLITLVIIGVIAAITVPTIHANSQEKALKSSLKKNYSVLKQFFERYYFRNGERFIPDAAAQAYYLKAILKQDLNIMADCGFAGGGYYPCFGDTMGNVYKTYNGKSSINWALYDDGHLVLTDGSYIMLENGTNSTNLYISVDVNGPGKKPNRLGKDLFMFQIMLDGELKPMGAEGTKYPYETYCSDTSGSNMNGAGCTVKVLGQY